ncbi:hypothetical protein RHMOL_Rhmol01G0185100 [Rhododendron molle]|uniref:Uncharacterized protein n=1 Tax=Rhododendron molle TaxID=49168 RepID=A0ACC0Q496_RHOML|nr:hypothetical protein RHMOL_Rhmol01G0185100 [Rhododendron molle]
MINQQPVMPPLPPPPPPPPAPMEVKDPESGVEDADPPPPPPHTSMARPARIPWRHGFQEHYIDRIHYSRVARACPENEHRIIPTNMDFMDHVIYAEMPIHQEPYYHPNISRGQWEPQW